MLLEAIGSFIAALSLLNDGLTRKSEINREFFEGFIEPIWAGFSQVHEDYKKSISEYRNLVLQGEDPIRILDQIKSDSLLTQDLRAKLLASMYSISSRKVEKEKILYELIVEIHKYLDPSFRVNIYLTESDGSSIDKIQTFVGRVLKLVGRVAFSCTSPTKKQPLKRRIDGRMNSLRSDAFRSISEPLRNKQDYYQDALATTQRILERIQASYSRVSALYFSARHEYLK